MPRWCRLNNDHIFGNDYNQSSASQVLEAGMQETVIFPAKTIILESQQIIPTRQILEAAASIQPELSRHSFTVRKPQHC